MLQLILLFYLATQAFCGQILLSNDVAPLSDLMIEKINALNTTWKVSEFPAPIEGTHLFSCHRPEETSMNPNSNT